MKKQVFTIRNKYLTYSTLLIVWCFLSCHRSMIGDQNTHQEVPGMSIMFYNVENLFDTFNDSLTNDDEFTPTGIKHWTWKRYNQKLHHTYKVIAVAGKWEAPDVIGFCEIENRYVLNGLVNETPLAKFNYKVIHEDSPDTRGIDVALIYRPDRYEVLEQEFITVPLEGRPTREILMVKGINKLNDTLHIFVNHWPSRRGGQAKSEPKRIRAAQTLKNKVDSILALDPLASVVITGDFNDYPDNHSLKKVLQATEYTGDENRNNLYNLAYPYINNHSAGTHKYKSEWGTLDQFIVSAPLMTIKAHSTYHILAEDFLLEPDEKYLGKKPFRTYVGPRYLGGFSDHLPIILNIYYHNQER